MTSVYGVRFAVGYAAVAATAPYLALKVVWLSGGTIGMADPAYFSDPAYVIGNFLTVGMDAVAVLIALAFTHDWGLRLPAWLVLFPTWVAIGFLAPIFVVMPFAPIAFDTLDPGSGPLRSWVYLFVYTGFAAQGLLLSAAFVLHARVRWGYALAGRNGDIKPVTTRTPLTLLTLSVVFLATVVGAFHLAWALGSEVGLSGAVVSDPPIAYRLTNGVYAAFAFASAVGLPMLAYGRPRRVRFWVPLSLAWAGTGSLFAWGFWQTATVAVRPELGSALLFVVMPAKMLAASLAGVTALSVLRGRFGPPSS